MIVRRHGGSESKCDEEHSLAQLTQILVAVVSNELSSCSFVHGLLLTCLHLILALFWAPKLDRSHFCVCSLQPIRAFQLHVLHNVHNEWQVSQFPFDPPAP